MHGTSDEKCSSGKVQLLIRGLFVNTSVSAIAYARSILDAGRLGGHPCSEPQVIIGGLAFTLHRKDCQFHRAPLQALRVSKALPRRIHRDRTLSRVIYMLPAAPSLRLQLGRRYPRSLPPHARYALMSKAADEQICWAHEGVAIKAT